MSTADENLKQELAARTKSVVARSGLTQKAIADLVGTAPGFMSDIVNGRKLPSLHVVRGLHQRLGVPLDWYLCDDGSADQSRPVPAEVQAITGILTGLYYSPGGRILVGQVRGYIEAMVEREAQVPQAKSA